MNRKVFPFFCIILFPLLSLAMTACGGGGHPIVVTLTGTSQSAIAGQTVTLTATVTHDSKSAGVTWTLSGPGALSGQTATAATYTAPSPIAETGTAAVTAATVTATSLSDPKSSESVIIILQPVTISLSPNTMQTMYQTQTLDVTASVSNDPKTMGVTWSLSPAIGSLTGQTATAVTYNAPASVPTHATVNLIAISIFDNTITTSLTINLVPPASACNSGSESLMNGRYVFVLKGFANSGNPALFGGILDFNGTGGITGGAIDENLSGGVYNLTVASGSYSVGGGQRGCMTVFSTAFTQYSFRFSLGNITGGVASVAHVIGFDTGPFTAGRMYKQTGGPFSVSSLNGIYVFGGSSIQNSAAAVGGGKFGVVGFVTLNGNGGVTAGAEDFNDNGTLDGSAANATWPASPIPISGGTYNVSSNGRVELSITVGGQIFSTILYAVSSSQALLMTSDAQTTANVIAGEAFQQSGGPFAANPLSGTYIGYDSGLGSGAAGTTREDIILLGPLTSGSSTLTGTQLRNDAGVFSSSAVSGTYSGDSTGRLLVSGGGHEPVFYLVSLNQAFFLNGNGGVDSGYFESQSGGPFSNSTASGTYAYGTIDPEAAGSSTNSGVAVFANPYLSTTEDDNSSGTLTVGSSQDFFYSVDATGLGHVPASCTLGTNCQTLFYMISPTKAVVMNVTSTNPTTQVADK